MELKEALVQYCELREEIKDLRERIERDEIRLRRIEEEGVVSDTVRGTRKDGTIGPIKITGFPVPEYRKVKAFLTSNGVKRIHLFAAIPVTFAIGIGQAYNPNYDADIITYDFKQGSYHKALTIGGKYGS